MSWAPLVADKNSKCRVFLYTVYSNVVVTPLWCLVYVTACFAMPIYPYFLPDKMQSTTRLPFNQKRIFPYFGLFYCRNLDLNPMTFIYDLGLHFFKNFQSCRKAYIDYTLTYIHTYKPTPAEIRTSLLRRW